MEATMNAHTTREEARAIRLTPEEVADLLSRYPHVSASEAKLILTFLRSGRHLDVGMLTADDGLKPQLDSFMADHARHFRVGFGEGAAVVAGIAALLALCWLVWEAIKPGAV
jgi:hypothetical protein